MYFRWPGFLSLRIPNGVTEFLPDGPTVTWRGEGGMCMEEIPFGVYIHVLFSPPLSKGALKGDPRSSTNFRNHEINQKGKRICVSVESDQHVNICSFAIRCDRGWPSTQ